MGSHVASSWVEMRQLKNSCLFSSESLKVGILTQSKYVFTDLIRVDKRGQMYETQLPVLARPLFNVSISSVWPNWGCYFALHLLLSKVGREL